MKIRNSIFVIVVFTVSAQTPPAPRSDSASISYKYNASAAASTSVHDVLARSVNILDFGGKCDGASHPLSATYPSLQAAKAVYPFVSALTEELDWAAIMAAQNALPVNPGGTKTAKGNPIHMGRLLFPPSTCVIGETLLVSPEVTIQGTGGYGSLAQGGPASNIQLRDHVATGSEYFVVAVDPAKEGANSTFGVAFRDIQIDCQGGNGGTWTGHNAGSSGLLFYGAQGSTWENLVVENCGKRGVVMQRGGASGSGLAHFGSLWIGGVIQGPGLDIQATNSATFSLISAEYINPKGTHKDSDGDANAGIRIVGSGDVQFTQIETEHVYFPLKIQGSWNTVVEHASIGPTGDSKCPEECAGPGIKILGGSRNTSIRNWTTYRKAPYLYSVIIADLDNAVTLPGNLTDYPVGSYEQDTKESYLFDLRVLGEASFKTINATAINSTGGYQAKGASGISRTVVLKGSNGADCNLVFTSGLLTSTTCP